MTVTGSRTGDRRRPGARSGRGIDAADRVRRGRRTAAERASTSRPTRNRAVRRRWVAALSVLGVLLLAYLLLFTSMLGVRSVEVLGAKNVPGDQIRTAAAVPELRAMLRLDTDEIRDRVVALPGVATADVSRSFPSTVEITVTERTGIGYLKSADGAHVIDASGVDFKTTAEAPAGLPELTIAKTAPDDPVTVAIASVLAGVPPQLRERVAAAGANTPGSVELTLADGKVIRWGDAQQNDRKAKVLAALLTQPGQTYDVSSPELPTIS